MPLIESSSYKTMAWRNGGGETAEIDRVPVGEGPFLWRLSRARIGADGPFSEFPGYERLLCVIEGGSILINEFQVMPLKPFRFSGEKAVRCQLTRGPVSDLGLIFDRDKFVAEMKVVEGPVKKLGASTNYFFDLQTGHTFKTEGDFELTAAKSIWVSIEPRAVAPRPSLY